MHHPHHHPQSLGSHGLTEDECDLLLLDDSISTNGLVALQNATGDLSPLPVHRKSIDMPPSVQMVASSTPANMGPPLHVLLDPSSVSASVAAGGALTSVGRFTPVQQQRAVDSGGSNLNVASAVPAPPPSALPRISISVAASAAAGRTAKTPLPSPAACGKRKLDELSAARMMAAVSSADNNTKHSGSASAVKSKRDEAFAVPLDSKLKLSFDTSKSFLSPEHLVPKNKTSAIRKLSIVDPDELRPLSPIMGAAANGLEPPNTPWEGALLALQHLDAPVPPVAATPEQLSQFYPDLVHLITSGAEKGVAELLANAEAVLLASHRGASGSAVVPLGTIIEEDSAMAEREGGLRSEKDSAAPFPSGFAPLPRTLASMLSSPLNPNGDTALLLACSIITSAVDNESLLNICKILVDKGSSTAVVNNKGATCLHLVAASGAVDIGRLLIRKGCPLNAIDCNGNTALHIASAQSHLQFIELLIEFGANCHIRNFDARSAIDIAASNVSLDSFSLGVWASLRTQTRDLMLSKEQRLRTLILYHDDCLRHSPRSLLDWEGPDRLEGIMASLRNTQLFKAHELKITNQFDKADVDLLLRVHCPEYISFVNSLSKQLQGGKGEGDSEELPPVPFTPHVQRSMQSMLNDTKPPEFCDTTFSAGTLRAARRAAGAVAHAVDCVLLGRNRNAFCVVRPPGHHAGYRGLLDGAKSCGFCIFNNIAAGALHALDAHYCERVAIVDIDIHHGNGTEDIVRKCNRPEQLFFFSVHLYDREDGYDFFPGSGLADDTVIYIYIYILYLLCFV
jgi:acetoin utilization deacetylase AcuC-like enzyme